MFNVEQLEGQEQCWKCEVALQDLLFCSDCEALQPLTEMSVFAHLNVPLQLAIDEDQLSKKYIALQQRLHPDLYVRRSKQEQAYATQHTANLNRALLVLQDPLQRAQHLIEHNLGAKISDETLNASVPVEKLSEIMMLREEIIEVSNMEQLQLLKHRAKHEFDTTWDQITQLGNMNKWVESLQQLGLLNFWSKVVKECEAKEVSLAEEKT